MSAKSPPDMDEYPRFRFILPSTHEGRYGELSGAPQCASSQVVDPPFLGEIDIRPGFVPFVCVGLRAVTLE